MNTAWAGLIGAVFGVVGTIGAGWFTYLSQKQTHDTEVQTQADAREAEAKNQREAREAEAKSQREAREVDEMQRVETMRREAYTNLLVEAKHVSAAWWKLVDLLREEHSSPSAREVAFLQMLDAWTPFVCAAASVKICGPKVAAESAKDLEAAVGKTENIARKWWEESRGRQDPRNESREREFRRADAAREQEEDTFQDTACTVLGLNTVRPKMPV